MIVVRARFPSASLHSIANRLQEVRHSQSQQALGRYGSATSNAASEALQSYAPWSHGPSSYEAQTLSGRRCCSYTGAPPGHLARHRCVATPLYSTQSKFRPTGPPCHSNCCYAIGKESKEPTVWLMLSWFGLVYRKPQNPTLIDRLKFSQPRLYVIQVLLCNWR